MDQSAFTRSAGNRRPDLMEHRWGQRLPCRAQVRLSAGAGASGEGRIRDISSSGAFIETAVAVPIAARVLLVVKGNESATREVEISASVVRVARDGIGIEWCDTPAESVCRLVGCNTRCQR